MNKLTEKLLVTDELGEYDFNTTFNDPRCRGSYNPMRFVVRLRKDIHEALKETDLSFNKIQAFSTYMHENIHWWQHVGSNIGFITSLSYPTIAHASHKDLKALIEKKQKYKPLISYDEKNFSINGKHDIPEINRILNNWHDIKYAKQFILDNKNIYEIAKDKRFFLSIGHSFHILWSMSIHILASTIDPNYDFLPKIKIWPEEFKKLENEKAQGFVIDSGIQISPLGTKAIFEGQARFNQLQYLTIALNNEYTISDFQKIGMLNGIYTEAFDLFLEITKISRPTSLNNSTIGLFLLLCDIAINPTDGFPIDIFHFKSFIISNDPGLRFIILCDLISKDKEKWKNAVKEYSIKEYTELSEELSKKIACLSPLSGSSLVVGWIKNKKSVQDLLEEERNMKFDSNNLAVRLYLSKFLRFQEDKLKYPNIFCWIGKSMTSELSKDITLKLVEEIFEKHKALFIDDIDGIIKPMLFKGYSNENIKDTFEKFYTYNITYDMILKWILEKGEFTYDYTWLTTEHGRDKMKDWVRENFKNAFEIYPEDLTVIK